MSNATVCKDFCWKGKDYVVDDPFEASSYEIDLLEKAGFVCDTDANDFTPKYSGGKLLDDGCCEDKDTFGSVKPNQDGVGGGVGTATIEFPDSVKNDAVCGVQSNSVLDTATGLITTELNDSSKLVSCEKQYKGLRDNGDGTFTEIFIDQAGNEVTGLTMLEPTQTGEPQLGSVLADGTTTYIDADGNTQTITATDVDGNPVDPSQSVWNMIDGDGNYLGSKPCKDETVLLQDSNGVVYPIDPVTGNQILNPLPCVSIVKVADTELYSEVGDVLTYRYIVHNCGPVDLPSVQVGDNKVTVLGGPISLAVGPTDSTTFTSNYTVTQADIDNGKVENIATASAEDADGNKTSDIDHQQVPFVYDPCIPICWRSVDYSVNSDLPVDIGNEQFSYSIAGAPFATVSLSCTQGVCWTTGPHPQVPQVGAPSFVIGESADINAAAFDVEEGTIRVDFAEGQCGPVQVVLFDFEMVHGMTAPGNTTGTLQEVEFLNFVNPPDRILYATNGSYIADPTMANAAELVETSPGVYNPDAGYDYSMVFQWDNVDCLKSFSFDFRLAIGGQDQFGFLFNGTPIESLGCRKAVSGEFFDANDELIDEPEGWVDGDSCPCNCP